MDIVRRVQDILLKPRETWPTIASEPGDVASLYKNYLLILAAIPPLAGFIGMSLIGFGFIRIPLMFGLSSMVAQYVLTLVMVYVLALVVDALAPTFGGMRDKLRALKLVVYGSTAAMVGGIFSLLPALSILGLVAALYSIYLFYLGLPVLMRCPQDKAVAYTAVVGVISIVAGLVVGALAAATLPAMHGRGAMWGGAPSDTTVRIGTPKGDVTIDTAKMQEFAKQMEAVGERAQKAAVTGIDAAKLEALARPAVKQ